jgi:hypothetical protein
LANMGGGGGDSGDGSLVQSGIGGSSIMGGGGTSRTGPGVLAGFAGNSYGGGGSGGVVQSNATPSVTGAGGAGAAGVVIVEEFY